MGGFIQVKNLLIVNKAGAMGFFSPPGGKRRSVIWKVIGYPIQVWEFYSHKQSANTKQTPSKQQNELWPSMPLEYGIYISISRE